MPWYFVISSGQISGPDRNSTGVILTSSTPNVIGTVRNPTIPMSWKVGSQDTITSVSKSNSARSTMALTLEYRLP